MPQIVASFKRNQSNIVDELILRKRRTPTVAQRPRLRALYSAKGELRLSSHGGD